AVWVSAFLRLMTPTHYAECLIQAIADAAHCANRVGLSGPAEGLAQPADVDVHRALVDIDVAAPDTIEQLLAREDAAGPQHEELEQPVFGRAEADGHAAPAHTAGLPVELEIARRKHGCCPGRVASPKQSGNAGQQLGQRERL